jgi:hypothetical protein
MKTFQLSKLLLPALLLIGALSCKKSEITPLPQQSTLSADVQESSSNGAITYNYQTDIDLTAPEWYEINECTGEHLKITSGIWQFVMHGTYSNHAFLMSIHNNIQNYKLVSLETGIEYTGNSTWNGHYNFPVATPYSFTLSIVNSVILTTSGGGNNSRLVADLHVTVDPNGKVTVSIDDIRAGCQ